MKLIQKFKSYNYGSTNYVYQFENGLKLLVGVSHLQNEEWRTMFGGGGAATSSAAARDESLRKVSSLSDVVNSATKSTAAASVTAKANMSVSQVCPVFPLVAPLPFLQSSSMAPSSVLSLSSQSSTTIHDGGGTTTDEDQAAAMVRSLPADDAGDSSVDTIGQTPTQSDQAVGGGSGQVRWSVCRQRLVNVIDYKREQWHRAARFATTLHLIDEALAADPTLEREATPDDYDDAWPIDGTLVAHVHEHAGRIKQ